MGQFKVPSTMVQPKPMKKEKKAKAKKKVKTVIKVQDVSQSLVQGKPYWAKFILDLGYPESQAKVFAEMHTSYMVDLAELVKKQATEFIHGMLGAGEKISITMALVAARIDADDFFKRLKPKKAGKKKALKKSKGK